MIYVWGSGITFPMVVPQPANSPILQLSMGRTRRFGVTEDGKVAKWDVSGTTVLCEMNIRSYMCVSV